MRKPIAEANPVTPPEPPTTAIVLVGSYELNAQKIAGPFVLFRAFLPMYYRVEHATYMAKGGSRTHDQLTIRVRQFGEGAVQAIFLVVFNAEGRVNLPRVKPTPHDPPDSAMLQWSFWQGLRVGGGFYHDVYDVTHLDLELPADA